MANMQEICVVRPLVYIVDFLVRSNHPSPCIHVINAGMLLSGMNVAYIACAFEFLTVKLPTAVLDCLSAPWHNLVLYNCYP